jgi:hypothetical protein
MRAEKCKSLLRNWFRLGMADAFVNAQPGWRAVQKPIVLGRP